MKEVWWEKHRPVGLDELVGQDGIVGEMRQIVSGKAPMQHYLFYSPEPGTGKTSMAEVIARELDYHIHKFNASSKRQRGIDFIEEDISPLSRIGQWETLFFLDEADQLTPAAQSALKGVIEDACGYFILTCNDLNKVSPWLQSRCQVRTFSPIEKNAMLERLAVIATREGAQVRDIDLERIVRRHSGDLRNAIGALQTLACLPDEGREAFSISLDAPAIDAEKILRLCFKEQCLPDAVKEMNKAPLVKAIDAVFSYAMNSTAQSDNKLRVIDAAIISRRDLLAGVEEPYVRHNFCRLLLGSMENPKAL